MSENHSDNLEIKDPEYEYANREESDEEKGYYGTGSTTPPKDYAGVVALVLVLLIILSGLLTALGLLDIHPFRQKGEPQPDSPARFSESDGDLPDALENKPEVPRETQAPTQPMETCDGIQLKPSPAGRENLPAQGRLPWQDVYEKVIPSVVSITALSDAGGSSGTGVIMDEAGYIVTNAHVVEHARKIQVLLTDGRVVEATGVGADLVSDLAVLHIEADGLIPAEFGDSTALRVGDEVVAIGDPLGVELRGTMTDGIISAISRDLKISGKTMTLLQTTAALNSGNSGGPLVNGYGQVVGINTMKIGDYASASGVEGLGFAIPMASAKPVIDQLISAGYVSGRPSLGFHGDMVPGFYQYYYRLPVGLLIKTVDEGSSAEEQGIQGGDILLALNGTRITGLEVLEEQLYGLEAGQQVPAVIYRGGTEYELTLTIGEAH